MKYILSLFMISYATVGIAQSVSQEYMGPVGDITKSDGYSVSWSAGEVASETLQKDDYFVTQGFQQTFYVEEVEDNTNVIKAEPKAGVRIYPNPVEHLLMIEPLAEHTDSKITEITITDSNGTVVNHIYPTHYKATLDFGKYTGGIYLIQVHTNKGLSNTYKVIKY